MKIKDFVKSTAFKCIIVLLCIALISGGLLSVLNDLLYVSEEEKIQRVISSLYDGQQVEFTAEEISESDKQNSYGTINTVYSLSDGNLIINSTGSGGYKGGSVTVWTIVIMSQNQLTGIKAVSIDSYEKQTLMSQLNASFLSTYSSNNELVSNGEYFTTSGNDIITSVTTGATMSSNATNNAVNAALSYVRNTTEVNG